jgi:hypothetical protein
MPLRTSQISCLALVGWKPVQKQKKSVYSISFHRRSAYNTVTDPEILLDGGKISYDKNLYKEYIINWRTIK